MITGKNVLRLLDLVATVSSETTKHKLYNVAHCLVRNGARSIKVQILNSPFFLVADIHLFPWQGKSFSKMAQSSQYKRSKRKTKCLWLRGKIFWTLNLL